MASMNSVSRRRALKKAVAALGAGAAAGLLGESAATAQARPGAQAPAILTGTQAGRKFRAFMTFENAPGTSIQAAKSSIETVTMKPLSEDRIVVRTEAAQVCYTIVGQVVGNYKPPQILGHSAVGIVEAIGSRVKRVQVGDRVILANTPQCGVCYNCLRGRADRCINTTQNPPAAIGTLSDGTDVLQQHDRGGFAELVIATEAYAIPIFHNVSPLELSMLGCSGACGLGTTLGVAPVTVGADVVVLGCGPLGLSAVQGARIKGASQIIAVEPIPARRAVAQQLGATTVIDPNVDTANVVAKIRDLCKGPSDRLFAGGRTGAQAGPDFVIEAVGGDLQPAKLPGPDPTGVLPLQWAWTLCSPAGHVTTVSVGQKGNFTVPAGQWSNGGKNHHPGNFNGVSVLKDMDLYARLIEHGQFNAKALGPDTFPLDRAKDALQAVADRTIVGAAIVFS